MDEYRFRFSAHQSELEKPLKVDQAIAYKGEGEVTEKRVKSITEGTLTIYTLRPKLTSLVGLEAPIYKESVSTHGTKSPSKRLRDTLYVYWEQQLSGKHPVFDDWYDEWIENKINEIKEYIK